MKILLIGAGGREHALAWKIAQSPRCTELFIAPGNAGTRLVGTNVYLSPTDFPAIEHFVAEQGIDLIVVGPEQPLVVGIADYFLELGVPVIGPVQEAAQLEGSKEFSKRFMQKYQIPTARYAAFETEDLVEALHYVKDHPLPVVVKASGLAAGKGVLICETHKVAAEAVKKMLSGEAFGKSGKTIVIEEFLKGIEISIFVLTDGEHYLILPPAKDYKRAGENDTGLNTGGMGAVSPVPFADEAFMQRVEAEIVQPTLKGLQAEGIVYKGFIFIGLMVVEDTPYVLEYNVRMGDPETEVVIPRLKSDLVALFEGVRDGNLHEYQLEIDPQFCTTIMLVSGGYPGPYEKGKEITGLEKITDSMVFHAGTIEEGDQVLTNGGRVLAISAMGATLEQAIHQSLTNAVNVQFEGKYYRTDIGKDLMGD